MKKLLLLAAVAATAASMNAETFTDFFKLTYGDQVIENGQTVTVSTYWDDFLKDNPEVANDPSYTPTYMAQAKLKAANIYDEAMDIVFALSAVEPKIETFQLCYEFDSAPGQCLGPKDGVVKSPADMPSISPEGYIVMDVDQTYITDMAPATLKLDLYVTEGGEKLEGTDYTVNITFTHEKDITAAVEGIEADSCSDCPAYYFTLQGAKVVNPEKGNIYIECKGSKVTKRIFK